MYWRSLGKVEGANLDGSNRHTVANTLNCDCPGLALDTEYQQLYYTEGGSVFRVNVDGTWQTTVFTPGGFIYGLTVDPASNKLYYAQMTTQVVNNSVQISGFINSRDLTTGQTNSLSLGNTRRLYGVALDVLGGKIYWTELLGGLKRANINLTGSAETFSTASAIYNIAFDDIGYVTPTPTRTAIAATATPAALLKTLFWTNGVDKIQAINADGTNQRTLATPGGNPVGIAFDAGASKLYWAQNGANTVQRSNFDGSGVTRLARRRHRARSAAGWQPDLSPQ